MYKRKNNVKKKQLDLDLTLNVLISKYSNSFPFFKGSCKGTSEALPKA